MPEGSNKASFQNLLLTPNYNFRGWGGIRDRNILFWEISYFKCVRNFPLTFQAGG